MAIVIKSDDTAPFVRATLLDFQGNPVNLAGATVRFILATKATPHVVSVDAPATNLQVTDGSDGSKGKVQYAWAVGDTATPGEFVAEFEVTFSDLSVQTFPTKDYIAATITADLGGT